MKVSFCNVQDTLQLLRDNAKGETYIVVKKKRWNNFLDFKQSDVLSKASAPSGAKLDI